jgi:hypothetical protein
MINEPAWLEAGATVALLVLYELGTTWAQQRHPARLARSAHARLREGWFAAVSAQRGSEILAVQTLRNSLMSATMTASTAALGLVASLTLTAPSLHDSVAVQWSPRLMLELVLIALLFASHVASAMAVRYFNHTSFICGIPTDSSVRQQWAAEGAIYVRRAGLLYSWGLRQLVLVAPILAALLHPLAGPPAALAVIVVLVAFDRVVT